LTHSILNVSRRAVGAPFRLFGILLLDFLKPVGIAPRQFLVVGIAWRRRSSPAA
jgi:hypothetical protein